jgi:cytochrome c oxidase subunit 2
MVAAVLTLAGVALAGCDLPTFGGNRGVTTQGHSEFKLWSGFVIAALAVGALVWILIFWSVIRYRRRNDESLPKQTRYNMPWEFAYTITPILVVAVLFAFTVATENNVDALNPPAVRVKVTAFQWGWRFDYSGTHVSIIGNYNRNPQLVLPAKETTQITLVSNDVVHGFYVPAFNFSRFAQPGVVNQFDLTPNRSGYFRGQCTQYCGLYHSLMRFSVLVLPSDQYRTWLSGQQLRAAA